MIDNSKRARFASNNFLETGFNSLEVSSVADGYFKSDLYSDERSRTFKFGGRFLIEEGVNDVFTVDGDTYIIPAGNYTGQTLADYLTSILDGVTCSAPVKENSYKFNFSSVATFTLNITEYENSIWTTIGYSSEGADIVASVDDLTYYTTADFVRLHWPYEEIKINLGYQASIGFVGIIGDLTKEFKIPENAFVTLMANNVDDFTDPPLFKELVWSKSGFHQFIDDVEDSNWQYVLIRIEHTDGPWHSEIGYLYIGDYATVPTKNIGTGLGIGFRDTSKKSSSDDGQQYTNLKTTYRTISGISVTLATPEDVNFIKRIYYLKQTSAPFFVALDPKLFMSETIDEKTVFCRFSKEPDSQHVVRNMFNLSFELEEVI